MEEIKAQFVDVLATIKWVCPECNELNIEEIGISPYSTLCHDGGYSNIVSEGATCGFCESKMYTIII